MEKFNNYRRISAKVEDNLKFKAEEVVRLKHPLTGPYLSKLKISQDRFKAKF
jgi:hypothetical protein